MGDSTTIGERVSGCLQLPDNTCNETDAMRKGLKWGTSITAVVVKILAELNIVVDPALLEGVLNATNQVKIAHGVTGLFDLASGVKMIDDGVNDLAKLIKKIKSGEYDKIASGLGLGSSSCKLLKGASLVGLGFTGPIGFIQTCWNVNNVAMSTIGQCVVPLALALNCLSVVKCFFDIGRELKVEGSQAIGGEKLNLKLVELAEKIIAVAVLILILARVPLPSPWILLSLGLTSASLAVGRMLYEKTRDSMKEARKPREIEEALEVWEDIKLSDVRKYWLRDELDKIEKRLLAK